MSFHIFAICAAFILYAAFLKKSYTQGAFVQVLKGHILFWYPHWWHRLKNYKKLYSDPDLVKIARIQAGKVIWGIYHKPYALIAILWSCYFVYNWLAPYFDFTIAREFDFVYRQCWAYAILAGWCWGTIRANRWATMHLVKAPSQLILAWGELYRKGLLTNPLHVKLVEKYWYICAIRNAMAHTAEPGLGFGLVKTPEGNLYVDACKLPEVLNMGEGRLKVNLAGFPVNYEAFVQYSHRKILPYTKFRTISLSKSGENSVINWEIDHNNLPSGDWTYDKAPKEVVEDEPVLGWTGRKFFTVQLKKFPHILVAGNTRMGKSTFYNVIIASLHPNTIILIADPKKDALDFRWLMRDPYGLSELKKMRSGRHEGYIPDFMLKAYPTERDWLWLRDIYQLPFERRADYEERVKKGSFKCSPKLLDSDDYVYYKNKLHPIPSVVVADSMNRSKRIAQWLWSEFLRRKGREIGRASCRERV